MPALELTSPCKINLLLNILGRRADGFHDLETIFQPVPLHDHLSLQTAPAGITLTCNHPELPTGPENLVFRAADRFLAAAGLRAGIKIHLTKNLPLAAGLGGGSANAAVTLRGLNQLFSAPLDAARLHALAAELGSDVPFFLQDQPALATGRGELLTPLPDFPALRGAWVLLIHPGFGVSTAWAYQALAQFPAALNGRPGRAKEVIQALQGQDLSAAGRQFYNSLEAPVLRKYPLLELFQEFLRDHGAAAALMSGSGSTTFALARTEAGARTLLEQFKGRFGDTCWTALAAL